MGSPSGGKEVPRQSSRALLYANDGLCGRRKRAVLRVDRLRAQPENVHPGGKHLAQRVSAGEADRVATRQQIPQTGDETELFAFWSPELHVEEPDGLDLPVTGVGAPHTKREHRRRRLRGLELPVGKTDRSDERRRPGRALADGPRNPRRGDAVRGREENPARTDVQLRGGDPERHLGRGTGPEIQLGRFGGEANRGGLVGGGRE